MDRKQVAKTLHFFWRKNSMHCFFQPPKFAIQIHSPATKKLNLIVNIKAIKKFKNYFAFYFLLAD